MSTYAKNVAECFRNMVAKEYDLDEDTVKDLGELVVKACDKTGEPTGKRKATKAKRPRRKSGYNVYVREMMATDEIKKIDHRSKMTEIGRLWKALNDDERQSYNAKAAAEEDAPKEEVVVEETVEEEEEETEEADE